MSAEEQTRFLSDLAEALNQKDISLPSFPDVVINIRKALEDPSCSSERLADVVKTDPVLVSRLLMTANSAFHNRAGIEIVDISLAVSRLGFETVRNTALALAVEQIFNASKHEDLKALLEDLWTRSVNLSSMCFVIAQKAGSVNSDNGYLCGLLHEIGKLYILTKAKDFPEFLGDSASLETIMTDWAPSIGRSIVESWGFPDEIVATVDSQTQKANENRSNADLVDIVIAAQALLQDADGAFENHSVKPSLDRLALDTDAYEVLLERFESHLQSQRQSLAA